MKAKNVSKNFCRRLKRALWYGAKDLTSELLGPSNSNAKLCDEFRTVKSTLIKLLNGLMICKRELFPIGWLGEAIEHSD